MKKVENKANKLYKIYDYDSDAVAEFKNAQKAAYLKGASDSFVSTSKELKGDKKYTLEDFEFGLVMAGLIDPRNDYEKEMKRRLDHYKNI